MDALATSDLDYRHGISKGDLRRLVGDLKRAQQAILRIAMSDVWELVLLHYDNIAEVDLGDMIERAEAVLALSHRSRPVIRDLVRAAIVRHIRRRTRSWHDEEVATLVTVAGRIYMDRFIVRSGEPAKPRRLRGAARGEERSEEAVFTAQAQQQWRRRNHALVRRGSEWERRWEWWIENLLYMRDHLPDSRGQLVR